MREFVDLVRAWWKRDRIRVRPSEGRLFRLRLDAVLCFACHRREQPISAQVVARCENFDFGHAHVCYFCRTSQGDGELVVAYGEDGPAIEWRADGTSYELHVDDIEVFQPAGQESGMT